MDRDIFLGGNSLEFIRIYRAGKLTEQPAGEIITGNVYIRPADIVRDDYMIWRLFPTINIDKTADTPCDYPGAMGVPITALDTLLQGRNDGKSGFLILDSVKPSIDEKSKYQRLIIRNLHPLLPKVVELRGLLRRCGVEIIVEVRKLKEVQ